MVENSIKFNRELHFKDLFDKVINLYKNNNNNNKKNNSNNKINNNNNNNINNNMI